MKIMVPFALLLAPVSRRRRFEKDEFWFHP